jgi:transcription initiation factor TFIID subunit 2
MDLSTIKAKLEDGQYSNRFEFRDDVYQISANALIYNQPQSPIGKLAEKFRAYVDKRE